MYGARENQSHTIAIAYRASEWVLIDQELLDLTEVAKWVPNEPDFANSKNKNALLCILQHQQTKKTVVLGNAHLEHDPLRDHVKFAQAAYLLERAANYVRDNKGMRHSLPFICGGDFNSLPISSVLSAMYGEDITNTDSDKPASLWTVPNDCPEAQRALYTKVNQTLMRKADSGVLSPLFGCVKSAYADYQLPALR